MDRERGDLTHITQINTVLEKRSTRERFYKGFLKSVLKCVNRVKDEKDLKTLFENTFLKTLFENTF